MKLKYAFLLRELGNMVERRDESYVLGRFVRNNSHGVHLQDECKQKHLKRGFIRYIMQCKIVKFHNTEINKSEE